MNGPISIELLDPGSPAVRQRMVDYLAPHETRVMFILGNLRAGAPQTSFYLARRQDEWLGVAAYFGRHRSFMPFSLDAEVTRLLTRHVAGLHPQIEWLNGLQEIAAPALEELLRLGRQLVSDPRQVFMELDGLPPVQPWESLCRLQRPEDAPAVVRVLRFLGGGDPDAPATERELANVRSNAQRWVLECEGQIAATAATSGLAIEACQIIGVATDPRYRRRGFARSVCARLVRDMAGEGARRTVLFTNVDNTAAQRCYQGLGFRVTGDYCLAKFKLPASA